MAFDQDTLVRLGSLCVVKGGKRLKKEHSLVNYRTAHPYIRVTDFGILKPKKEQILYLTDDAFEPIRRYIINKEDIYISIAGTIGLVGKVDDDLHGANLTENAAKIVINEAKLIDRDYLLYYLFSERGQHEIAIRTVGSTQPKLGLFRIEDIPVPVPPLPEQRAIAAILSALDDKIELNRQVNKTLEEMAQAIFKEWFVDFGLFRDSGMQDSELGPIPVGWRVVPIFEIIANTIGGDWGKDSEQEKYNCEVQCIRGTDIPPLSKGEKGKPPVRYILEKNLHSKKLKDGDIVIEVSGGSPTQSTGRVLYISHTLIDKEKTPLICSNFCRILRPKSSAWLWFGYLLLSYRYNLNIFFQYENGTTGIKNLDVTSLLNKELIVLPDEAVLQSFNELIEAIYLKIHHNGSENESLTILRDTLLPKLMSGELRVPVSDNAG